MRNIFLAFFALAAANGVSAAASPQQMLPDCAKHCLDSQVSSMCSKEDHACHCNNKTYIQNAMACARSACSPQDYDTAVAVARAICAPLRTNAASSTVASTSTIESSSSSATPTSSSMNAASSTLVNGVPVYAAVALAGALVLGL
ncbi:hypothetical protein ONZ45_g17892 [Pleurotus djamor]|nr:hypothetical protein ONZ45_g17892 [Pleurotus djamor]